MTWPRHRGEVCRWLLISHPMNGLRRAKTCDHRIVLAVRRELGYYLIARHGNPIRVDPEEWANRWGDASALRKTAIEAGFSKPFC